MVISTIQLVLEKNEYEDDFRERIKQRFKEVYENALHYNVSVEGQTWSQAMEEGNVTKDYEPVDVELRKDVDAKALRLDELLVETTAKRREMPPKITQEITKRMEHLRHSAEQYTPVMNELEVDTSSFPSQVLSNDARLLEESGEAVARLSRDLPLLEDKASRLHEAHEMKSSMHGSRVYKVLSHPLEEESKMAVSMTPLRRRLADETPSPLIKPSARYAFRALKVQNHPINNNYKLK
ncbi:uncharacterized protein [Diadema setosum]|uniref:uncharacterized protein n=1 Tax=Diadema setosum TaxID=31175 RepID=UPI003B3AB6C7